MKLPCRAPACAEVRELAPVKSFARRLQLVLCLLASLSVVTDATIAQPVFDHPEYIVEQWQVDDGLPQNSVISIAQTPNGYLWFATFDGVCRFDGVRFSICQPTNSADLKVPRITRLLVDPAGALWLGADRDSIWRWTPDQGFTGFGASNGVPKSRISSMGLDKQGKVWFSGDFKSGCFRFAHERFEPVTTAGAIEGTPVVGLNRDSAGNLFAEVNRQLVRVDPPDLTVTVPREENVPIIVKATGTDASQHLLAASPTTLFRKVRGNWEQVAKLPFTLEGTMSVTEDRSGNIWCATWAKGLWRLTPSGDFQRFQLMPGPRPPNYRLVFQDKEGSLWVGTDGTGLFRLKPRAARNVTMTQGLAGDVVKSVSSDWNGNDVWALSIGGLSKIRTEKSGQFTVTPGSPVEQNWCVFADRGGGVWAGGFGTPVGRVDGDTPKPCVQNGAEFKTVCRAFFQDRAGTIWVGSRNGIAHIEGTEIVPAEFKEGFGNEGALAFAEDSKGRLFVGLHNGGLLVSEASAARARKWRRVAYPGDSSSMTLYALHVDASDSLWIGYSRGLMRMKDDRFFSFSGDIPITSGTFSILEDADKFLWLATGQGICRISREQLDRIAEGSKDAISFLQFDKSDGMGTKECSTTVQPAACKTADGKLWFATVHGVSVIDPKSLPVNTNPPPVVLEDVRIDDRVVSIPNDAPLIVPPGAHRVEIRYTGLSFLAPAKVHFRVQLAGMDPGWVDVGNRRVAYFTKLPHGDYTFKVTACNNDGLWNPKGVTMAMIVQPHIWERIGFQLAVVGAVLLGVMAIARQRIKELELRRESQAKFTQQLIDSQEAERKRIALELHDGLGQSLMVIKHRTTLALHAGDMAPAVATQLKEISDVSSQAVEDVRGLSHALRPVALDRLGLTRALEQAVSHVAAISRMNLRSEVDNVDGLFTPQGEITLYRVVQEILNNVVKHSDCSLATLRVTRLADRVSVLMQDDGRGFNVKAVLAGRMRSGLGMTSLVERVHLLGGELIMDSMAGHGCRTRIELPFSKVPPKPINNHQAK